MAPLVKEFQIYIFDLLVTPKANRRSWTSLPISETIINPVTTTMNTIPPIPIVVELTLSSGAEILLLLTLDNSSVLTLRCVMIFSTVSSISFRVSVVLLSGVRISLHRGSVLFTLPFDAVEVADCVDPDGVLSTLPFDAVDVSGCIDPAGLVVMSASVFADDAESCWCVVT